jgi:hypothetical protein
MREALSVDRRSEDRKGDELLQYRERLEELFVRGRVIPARGPVTLSEDELDFIERTSTQGVLMTTQTYEYLQWLRAGGRRGEPMPAAPARREPLISGMKDDFAVVITEADGQAHVAVLFSHEQWPGVRFGHRFVPDADGYEVIWFDEYVSTGGLDRLMSRQPAPDQDGTIWTG